jgi:hypothetical protein
MPCLKAFPACFRSFLEGVQLAAPDSPGGQGVSTIPGSSAQKAKPNRRVGASKQARNRWLTRLMDTRSMSSIVERWRTTKQPTISRERCEKGTLRPILHAEWELPRTEIGGTKGRAPRFLPPRTWHCPFVSWKLRADWRIKEGSVVTRFAPPCGNHELIILEFITSVRMHV